MTRAISMWAIYFPRSDMIDYDTLSRTKSGAIRAFGSDTLHRMRREHGPLAPVVARVTVDLTFEPQTTAPPK